MLTAQQAQLITNGARQDDPILKTFLERCSICVVKAATEGDHWCKVLFIPNARTPDREAFLLKACAEIVNLGYSVNILVGGLEIFWKRHS